MKVFKLLLTLAAISLGTVGTLIKSNPATAAERMSFSLPVVGEFYVSVDDLDTFARSGEITPSLAFYAKRVEEKSLKQFRQILQTSLINDPTTVYRITHTPLGEDVLRRLGELVYTHPQRNGFYAIRAAAIQGAAEPEGLTPISFLRHFPTKEIQLNASLVFSIVKEVGDLFEYKDTTVDAIAQASQQEIASSPLATTNSNQLPDLSQPGKYQYRRQSTAFSINSPRQTSSGFVGVYDLEVQIYLPVGLQKPAPLAVIDHGFGAKGSDYDYLAKHLASHGYAVALPEHGGSNESYKKAFLSGQAGGDIISPVEFYSRPRDITHLLNELEQSADFQGKINWSQVGILGHSLGGTTALLVSGAALNWDRVNNVCKPDQFVFNVSVFLQCRAKNLPPGNYNFHDPRIKGVVALNTVASLVLGPESMSQIEIPTLIAGGTQDMVAPFVEEQVHPFLWLNSKHKYLASLVGGNHAPKKKPVMQVSNSSAGSSLNLDENYYKILTLAFFNAHISDRPQYQSYLTAAYAENISNPELPIHLIRSLVPERLESAYGKEPPTAPIPASVMANSAQNRDVLAEIKQTGTLKMAIRTDAAPFGYLQPDRDWAGYCADFGDSLGAQLTQQLQSATPIKVVKMPSSLSTRFKLITEETAHIECGPNSVVTDREGITFSDPFFSSGTRLLTNNNNFSRLDFKTKLAGLKLGVLPGTTTKQFLEENYPEAEVVDFDGKNARNKGIQAIDRGEIDAFVSDDVLLAGELDRRQLNEEDYQAIPKNPLTCEYYGLILPEGDPQWRTTVNAFIRDRHSRKAFDKWLVSYYSQSIADLDYCQNKRDF